MTTPSLLHMQGICDKDCENKINCSMDPMFLTICNNCIHVKKRDHYFPKKAMEQAYNESGMIGKIGYKVINFLERGSR